MEKPDCVRIITGIMFDSPLKDAGEIMKRDPSIPKCLSASEFSEKLRFVFFIIKRIVAFRWRKFFDTCYETMLSTHEMYLTCVVFACFCEQSHHHIIFDRFVSVCAVVKILCEETLQKSKVDFSGFNSEIIRIVYMSRLLKSSYRCGGVDGFVEYIRVHRYLKWKSNGSFLSHDDRTVLFDGNSLDELIQKELKRGGVIEKEINVDEVAKDADSIQFANLVLSLKPSTLPPLPSRQDLIAYKQKGKAKKILTKVAENFENSNLDLQANLCSEFNIKDVKNQENTEWYEKIIQAVIIHNHSKNSGSENANNRIQNEADRIVEQFSEKIKSLMEVLDDNDKE